MLTIADLCIIGMLIAAGWIGAKQRAINQAAVAIAVVGGLCAAAFAYTKVAFLSQGTGTRAVLLLILTLMVVFLCYSAALSFAEWLRQVLRRPKGKNWRLASAATGSAIAICTAAIAIWSIATMFISASPAFLQRQLQASQTLAVIKHVLGAPPLFRNIEYLVRPFSAPLVFAEAEPAFASAGAGVGQTYHDLDQAVARARGAMVKIRAWGCGGTSEGSGFLVSPQLIMTNAHIIAGAERISVEFDGATFTVTPLWFDPSLDDAVLGTQVGLGAQFLKLQTGAAQPGMASAFLGYPDDGDLKTRDAVVLQLLNAKGYDIYGKAQTDRSVYALRAMVEPGNSGGPLINSDGEVLGMVFGHATTHAQTGYAIASKQLAPVLHKVASNSPRVATGQCTGE